MKLSRSASRARSHSKRSAIISLSLLLLGQIAVIESQPANNVTVSSTQTPVSTTTTTTTTTTTVQPSTTTTQQVAAAAVTTTQATTTTATAAVPSTTMREPSEQEIQEARKLIHEIASTLKDNPNSTRMVLNRPTILSQNQDFAPDSPEAKIADATSQFGLEFIKNLPSSSSSSSSSRQNVVISPVSMQILLNIILLGTKDKSATQLELMEVLGYSADQQANNNNSISNEQTRLKPHAAMHSLLEHISRATHLTVEDRQQQQQLLNVNGQLAAHLQTSAREGEVPLSGQVNFTLANLMLTNSDLAKTSGQYETDLRSFYDIKLERFSRLSQKSNATSGAPKNETTTSPTATSGPQLHERVNRWVQNITQGQIGSLVEEADLAGGDLAMVLLNAAHFKGRWLHTFNTKLTQERIFYNEGQEMGAKEVKFMRQNGVFGYGEFGPTSERSGASNGHHPHTSSLPDQETLLTEDLVTLSPASSTSPAPATSEKQVAAATSANDEEQQQNAAEAKRYELTAKLNCSALMLPFSLNDGQELSMIVLLPNKRDGLQELVNNLNGPALNEIYRSLSEQQVQVELPKFSFESSHDARATLLKMGLSKIFKDGAELDRMFAEPGVSSQVMPPVKVDKVIHKAKIAVDEVGAEAAAASAATIVLRNLIRPPNPSFLADHPFLFVIRHNRSNLPLFMGRIERL